jgi:intracellular sulfur oxidation DsrE/DsrF family protein
MLGQVRGDIMSIDRIVSRTAAVWAAVMLGWLAAAPVVGADMATAPQNRVVMQVSDGEPGKWNLALNNASNLQADLGAANVQIEIVAYGPGLGMLKKDSPVATRVDQALVSGVKIVACENTMRAQKLVQADMLPSIGYVGAGVVEIMQRQQQGWSYLRP